MKVLVIALLSLVSLAVAQNDRVKCFTGTRVQVDGNTVFDTQFPSYCPSDRSFCVKYEYTQRYIEGDIAFLLEGEYGECSASPVNSCSEDIYLALEQEGKVLSCNATSCFNDDPEVPCNNFNFNKLNYDCRVKENDVRAFPGCTLQESVEHVFECVAPFISNFPYSGYEQEQCHDNVNQMIHCFTKQVGKCLSSNNCPSMFDDISGFRSQFSEIAFWASSINNTESLNEIAAFFSNFTAPFTGFTYNVREVVDNYLCSNNFDQAHNLIAELEYERIDIDQLVSELFPSYNCSGAFNFIQNSGFQFLHSFYSAENQNEVYNAFVESVNNVAHAFENCDLSPFAEDAAGVFESVNFTLPEDVSWGTVLNVIVNATGTLPFKSTPDQCPSEGPGRYGQINLNCTQYEGLTSECGQRKYFLCNFANWRFNFLRTWLNEFYNQNDDNDDLPSCGDDSNYITCRNSDLCCYDAPKGCRLCYCSEHDYVATNQDILSAWRENYNEWNRFFFAYQQSERESCTPRPRN